MQEDLSIWLSGLLGKAYKDTHASCACMEWLLIPDAGDTQVNDRVRSFVYAVRIVRKILSPWALAFEL